MFKNIYRLFINTKLGTIDLFNGLELAKKYEKVYRNSNDIFTEVNGEYVLSVKELDENEPVFIKVSSDAENYVVFYENFFITYSISRASEDYTDRTAEDYIVRIHMKRQEDSWLFKPLSSGDGCDVLDPLNVNAEVYVKYNVGVLHLNRCYGEDYRSGSWNKMFYRTLGSFIEKVHGFTEINRIKKSYEK